MIKQQLVSTFRNRLIWISSAFVLLVVLNAGLGFWVTIYSLQLQDRIQFAHDVHKQYLVLSAQTEKLFQRLIRLVALSDNNKDKDKDKDKGITEEPIKLSRVEINATIDQIRAMIASEINLSDEPGRTEEEQELQFLATIERKLGHILTEFGEISTLVKTNQLQTAGGQLINTLEISVDHEFEQLINRAIAKEIEDVERVERAVASTLARLNSVMLLSIFLAIILGGMAYFLVTRRLRDSLELLLEGTRMLAVGNFSHQLAISGKDEFAVIAANYNYMADQINIRQQQLEQAQQHLEIRVEQAGQELREANASLTRLYDSRQKFLADISHELRTPITVIRGEAQFALRDSKKTAEACEEVFKRVLEQSRQLERLVDDLLFIARTDAGALPFKRARVLLIELLDTICIDAGVIAHSKEITIDFQKHVNQLAISGDEGRLRQLFLILLENAILYSNADSCITVTAGQTVEAGMPYCCIKISDKGKGIPAEELPFIFERYFRGESAKLQNISGSGLGLPMARAIVLAHNGGINIVSEIDHGTTVTVKLPVVSTIEAMA